jgi:integrase
MKAKKERNLIFKEGKWRFDFTHHGKRIRGFGGFTKEQARDALAKKRLELRDLDLGFKKPGQGEHILFEKFADDFLETYCKQNKRSWARDEISLNNLKAFFRRKDLQDVGAEDVERYKAQRRAEISEATGRQIAPATVNRETACLKTLFNKAVEWGRIETNPAQRVKKFREASAKERVLSRDEARRLIAQAALRIKPVLILALNTGMRKGEILSLKWKDIDFIKGFILISESKAGKSRTIPMNGPVFETLRGMEECSDYVFFNPGTQAHVQDIKTGFKAACRRAKIKELRVHDLRHTAASWMVEAGVDLVTVSKILGHSSIQMTMRYAHPTPENMRRAVEKLAGITDQTRQKVDMVEIRKPATYSKLYH